jgi:hypothetical protein
MDPVRGGLSIAAAGLGVLAVVYAVRLARKARDSARTSRIRAYLQEHSRFQPIRCLGMGREGVVFEVRVRDENTGGEARRALKVLDTREGRGLKRRLLLNQRIEAACAKKGLENWKGLPKVHDLDIFRVAGRELPYEEMEMIEGKTLAEVVAEGSLEGWTLSDRLHAFDQLLSGLHSLSEEGVHFVHIDADNVMMTPDRRLRLIDISGFRLKPLSPRRRRRIFRRLARTLLAILGDIQAEVLGGKHGEAARELFGQLETYRQLPKGTRPPQELELFSIRDLQRRIRSSFAIEFKRAP